VVSDRARVRLWQGDLATAAVDFASSLRLGDNSYAEIWLKLMDVTERRTPED
jgi:hypothetical protein